MILSKKSWHFKLHQILYGKYGKPPQNFCPYFWKTIVLGIISSPLLVLAIPMILMRAIVRLVTDKFDPPHIKDDGFFSIYFFMCLAINLLCIIVFCMFYMWFNLDKSDVLAAGGLGYTLLLMYISIEYLEWRKRRKHKKEYEAWEKGKAIIETPKKKNLLLVAIKAWYKKNCPIIDWK